MTGSRGPRSKPTALKQLEGNPGNRPLNEREPKPPAAPLNWEPPAHVKGEARREWKRLVGPLVRCGILTIADRDAFASYCTLHGRHVQAEWMVHREGSLTITPNGHKQVSPWLTISRDALTLKKQYAAELGLTPSSRSRIGATPPKAENTQADTPPATTDTPAQQTAPKPDVGPLIGKRPH